MKAKNLKCITEGCWTADKEPEVSLSFKKLELDQCHEDLLNIHKRMKKGTFSLNKKLNE